MLFLRQSTTSQSRLIGPFVDDTDFKTAEIGLTIANTDVKISVNGAASANKNSGGGTHRMNGEYAFTFDATDTATVGEFAVSILVSGALLVRSKFWVLEEAVYDALFAASAPGYATVAALDTVDNFLDAEIALILSRLGAITGSGDNTVLGLFKALMKADAPIPSDLGGTYDPATDSNQAMRDDSPDLSRFGILNEAAIAELTNQLDFTLTAGKTTDGVYEGCLVLLGDSEAYGYCKTYTGSTRRMQLLYDPGVYTIAVGDRVIVKPNPVPPGIKKGKARANFTFAMIDSTDDISGKTGVTVTAERSIDGGAFAACSNSASEIANGMYKINLSATDLAGDVITLKFTGSGCNATLLTLVTQL